MSDWRTDAEKLADEQDRPRLIAEAWFIGAMILVAVVAGLLAVVR